MCKLRQDYFRVKRCWHSSKMKTSILGNLMISDEAPTGTAIVIVVDQQSENTIVVIPGTNGKNHRWRKLNSLKWCG